MAQFTYSTQVVAYTLERKFTKVGTGTDRLCALYSCKNLSHDRKGSSSLQCSCMYLTFDADIFPDEHVKEYKEDCAYTFCLRDQKSRIMFHPHTRKVFLPPNTNMFGVCQRMCGSVVSIGTWEGPGNKVYRSTVKCRFCSESAFFIKSRKGPGHFLPSVQFANEGTFEGNTQVCRWVSMNDAGFVKEPSNVCVWAARLTANVLRISGQLSAPIGNYWSKYLTTGLRPMTVLISGCEKHIGILNESLSKLPRIDRAPPIRNIIHYERGVMTKVVVAPVRTVVVVPPPPPLKQSAFLPPTALKPPVFLPSPAALPSVPVITHEQKRKMKEDYEDAVKALTGELLNNIQKDKIMLAIRDIHKKYGNHKKQKTDVIDVE